MGNSVLGSRNKRYPLSDPQDLEYEEHAANAREWGLCHSITLDSVRRTYW
jgi:hypothetical protein